jgi:hypothetical protein
MPETARVVTTDAEIDLAIKHARQYTKYDRRVERVAFSKSADKLRLILDDGVICTIPRRLIQGLSGAQKKKLRPIQIIGGGTGLLWPLLDVAHSVPDLLTGVYGSSRWMTELASRLRSGQNKPKKLGGPISIDVRHRDLNGHVREKSGKTLVGTLRKTYGEDFLVDWRSDAKLSSVRQETEMSLNEMVRQHRLGKRLPAPSAGPISIKAARN